MQLAKHLRALPLKIGYAPQVRRLYNLTIALHYEAEDVSNDRVLVRDDLGLCNVMIDPEERGGLGRD